MHTAAGGGWFTEGTRPYLPVSAGAATRVPGGVGVGVPDLVDCGQGDRLVPLDAAAGEVDPPGDSVEADLAKAAPPGVSGSTRVFRGARCATASRNAWVAS